MHCGAAAAVGAGGGVTRCGGCRRGDHCWWSHTNAVCTSYAARNLPCNCTQQDAAWVCGVCAQLLLAYCVVLCLQEELCTSVDPDEAVARGCAVQAALLCGVDSTLVKHKMFLDVVSVGVAMIVCGCVANSV